MNQSYQNNFTSQRNYQKTSSLTNFQLDDIDNSPKSPKPSFLSSSTSQLNNKEAEFMMIEDGLSRHFNYIQKNLNRIPNFSSSEKAKEELKRLLEQLNQMENAAVPSEHPNIESRLSEISKQHQTLNNEEQVISKLRSTNDDDKARDDAEYESIKNKIKEAKEELSQLERQITQFHEKSTSARNKLDKAKNNLQSRQFKINQLKNEENRLLKLQKQSRHELKDIQNELNISTSEEAKIIDIEGKIEANSREFKRLSKVLSEKKEKVREKKERIQTILRETETLESRLDEAVGFAGTVTEKKKQEAYLTSDSDSNDIEKSLNVLTMNNSSINNKSSIRPTLAIVQSDDENEFNDNQNLSNSDNISISNANNSINNYSYQSSYRSNGLEKNKNDNFSMNQLSDDNEDMNYKNNLYQENEPTGSEDEQINIDDYKFIDKSKSSKYQKIDQPTNLNSNQLKDRSSSSSNYQTKDITFNSNKYQSNQTPSSSYIQQNEHSFNSNKYQSNQSANSSYIQQNEHSFNSNKYQSNQSANSSYFQKKEQTFNSSNYQPNQSYNSSFDHLKDQSFDSNNYQLRDHSSSSSHHQIKNQSHISNHQNSFIGKSDNMIIEEEEDNSFSLANSEDGIHSMQTKSGLNSSFKNNSSIKTTNIPSDSDSDDETNLIFDKYNIKNIDVDDDDDDEDDEEVKSLIQRNSQRHSSFSSKGNNSEITNAAYQAINTSLIDNSPVVQKVETATSQFKNSYI